MTFAPYLRKHPLLWSPVLLSPSLPLSLYTSFTSSLTVPSLGLLNPPVLFSHFSSSLPPHFHFLPSALSSIFLSSPFLFYPLFYFPRLSSCFSPPAASPLGLLVTNVPWRGAVQFGESFTPCIDICCLLPVSHTDTHTHCLSLSVWPPPSLLLLNCVNPLTFSLLYSPSHVCLFPVSNPPINFSPALNPHFCLYLSLQDCWGHMDQEVQKADTVQDSSPFPMQSVSV